MSSNIYYPERKLFKHTEKMTLLDKIRSLLSLTQSAGWASEIITVDRIKKILDLPYSGRSAKGAQFTSFSWQREEKYHDHPVAGRVFIPLNIHLTDGATDMYIVLIDDDYEVRLWPGRRLDSSSPENLRSAGVFDKEIMKQIEEAFAVLLDITGVDKTLGKKYADLKGKKIERNDLNSFLCHVFPHCPPLLLDEAFADAVDPAGYFEKHSGSLSPFDAPDEIHYQRLIIDAMLERRLIAQLDWKADLDEVNYALGTITQDNPSGLLTEDDGEDAESWLSAAGDKLEAEGRALLCWDLQSDEYTVFAADLAEAPDLMELAARCGITLQLMNGRTKGAV